MAKRYAGCRPGLHKCHSSNCVRREEIWPHIRGLHRGTPIIPNRTRVCIMPSLKRRPRISYLGKWVHRNDPPVTQVSIHTVFSRLQAKELNKLPLYSFISLWKARDHRVMPLVIPGNQFFLAELETGLRSGRATLPLAVSFHAVFPALRCMPSVIRSAAAGRATVSFLANALKRFTTDRANLFHDGDSFRVTPGLNHPLNHSNLFPCHFSPSSAVKIDFVRHYVNVLI